MPLRCERLEPPISQMGQSRHFDRGSATSGLPLGTDIVRPPRHVGEVPQPNSCNAANSTLTRPLVDIRSLIATPVISER
jgi:hypothetical protein